MNFLGAFWRCTCRALLAFMFFSFFSSTALAEGRCPPGQYPIGDERAPGCAPVPSGGGVVPSGPTPTGKWEKRWGAVAEDDSANARGVPLITGTSESRKSKRDADATAIEQCRSGGGQKCRVVISYYNQCVAVADPDPAKGGGKSVVYRAETKELASQQAMKLCAGAGGSCSIFYAACSLSEFKAF